MKTFFSSCLILFIVTAAANACRTMRFPGSSVKDQAEASADVDKQMIERIEGSCAVSGCHQTQQGQTLQLPNRVLKKFARQTVKLKGCFDQVADPATRVKSCLQVGNEMNHRLGLYKAAVNDDFFKTIFTAAGRIDRYAEMQAQSMPPGSSQNVFGDLASFNKLVDWIVDQGTRRFEGIDRVRPPEVLEGGICIEKISPELSAHIQDVAKPDAGDQINKKSWPNYYKRKKLPMFGCPEKDTFPKDPLQCLTDFARNDNYREPSVVSAGLEYSIRQLREMKPYTSFWTRSSPNGRFVGNGGFSPPGEERDDALDRHRAEPQVNASGSIEDLATPGRVIGVSEPYDPAFTPDNKSFIFVDRVCPVSLLTKSGRGSNFVDMATTPGCLGADGVSTYESVGHRVDATDDFYIVNPTSYSSDDGGASVDETGVSGDEDPIDFGPSALEIRYFQKAANGTFTSTTKQAQFNGEAQQIISPSSFLVSGRFGPRREVDDDQGAGLRLADGPVIGGYNLRFVDKMFAAGEAYDADHDTTASTICMKGNKASMSYDDRFVVTHHYTDAKDNPELAQKTSDLLIYDLVTHKSTKITNMPAGYFALYPHFRGDGWIYFIVRHRVLNDDANSHDYVMATDVALQMMQKTPTIAR